MVCLGIGAPGARREPPTSREGYHTNKNICFNYNKGINFELLSVLIKQIESFCLIILCYLSTTPSPSRR